MNRLFLLLLVIMALLIGWLVAEMFLDFQVRWMPRLAWGAIGAALSLWIISKTLFPLLNKRDW